MAVMNVFVLALYTYYIVGLHLGKLLLRHRRVYIVADKL